MFGDEHRQCFFLSRNKSFFLRTIPFPFSHTVYLVTLCVSYSHLESIACYIPIVPYHQPFWLQYSCHDFCAVLSLHPTAKQKEIPAAEETLKEVPPPFFSEASLLRRQTDRQISSCNSSSSLPPEGCLFITRVQRRHEGAESMWLVLHMEIFRP